MSSFSLSRSLSKWRDTTLSFVLEECGGNGSCLFHCVAVGASRLLHQTWSMEYVRDRLAASITEKTLYEFIELLMEDQKQHIINGSQQIDHSFDLQKIQELISEPGPRFQGSDITLRWLITRDPVFKKYGIGFVLFSSFGPGYTEILNEEAANHFILLFNHANVHWQLVNVVDVDNRGFSSISSDTLQKLKARL